MFFIGLTLLATSLEFSLGVDVALFADLKMMAPRRFLFLLCAVCYQPGKPGKIIFMIDNLFLECIGIQESLMLQKLYASQVSTSDILLLDLSTCRR